MSEMSNLTRDNNNNTNNNNIPDELLYEATMSQVKALIKQGLIDTAIQHIAFNLSSILYNDEAQEPYADMVAKVVIKIYTILKQNPSYTRKCDVENCTCDCSGQTLYILKIYAGS